MIMHFLRVQVPLGWNQAVLVVACCCTIYCNKIQYD